MFWHYASVTLRGPDTAALKHFHWLLCGVGEVAAIADLREMGKKMGGRCGCKQKSLATAAWEPSAANRGGKGRKESTTLFLFF